MVEDLHVHQDNLRQVLKLAQSKYSEAKIAGDKIVVNRKAYEIQELKELGIKTESLHQKENASEIHFRGALTPLSNFYPCKIVVEGMEYGSVEHMFQYLKAKRYQNYDSMASIMLSKQARTAKQEG